MATVATGCLIPLRCMQCSASMFMGGADSIHADRRMEYGHSTVCFVGNVKMRLLDSKGRRAFPLEPRQRSLRHRAAWAATLSTERTSCRKSVGSECFGVRRMLLEVAGDIVHLKVQVTGVSVGCCQAQQDTLPKDRSWQPHDEGLVPSLLPPYRTGLMTRIW